MIDVEQLVKWYGPTKALDAISFHIPAGEIVGFLGPNGAGKTTALRILTGYMPPTAGRAAIDGHDLRTASKSARARIGYLPENTPVYPEMRVEEYLHYRGRLMGLDRAKRRERIGVVAERCGLSDVRRRLVGQLSKGNRQRVGLAQALIHDPPVLILDEPTAGLDPNQVGEVRKLVGELKGEHTILLSTHILPEVERTADRVMIIAAGRIVAQGTPQELREQVATGARVRAEVKASPQAARRAVGEIEGVGEVEAEPVGEWCRLLVASTDGRDLREPIGQAILANGWPIREMRHETGSLEQYFVEITAEQEQASSREAA